MTAHTNESTQYLDMYGGRVCLRQTRLYEIEVSFMGGTHDDGEEVKTFPNMAEALAYVARIAADLEAEEGDDWGVDEDDDTFPEPTQQGRVFAPAMVRIECRNSLVFDGTTRDEDVGYGDKLEEEERLASLERLRDVAKGAVERHLGDVVEEGMSPDAVFDEAYRLAHDALVDRGVDARTARNVAQDVATELAQP